jgi:hypothetical protein
MLLQIYSILWYYFYFLFMLFQVRLVFVLSKHHFLHLEDSWSNFPSNKSLFTKKQRVINSSVTIQDMNLNRHFLNGVDFIKE